MPSDIRLVFIALALTVREKEQIALNLIYGRLPINLGLTTQQFWTAIIGAHGLFICPYGWEVVLKLGGRYWEMWHFAWENGAPVFKPNSMPKSYAVMIPLIAEALITLAAPVAIIEDPRRLSGEMVADLTPTGSVEPVPVKLLALGSTNTQNRRRSGPSRPPRPVPGCSHHRPQRHNALSTQRTGFDPFRSVTHTGVSVGYQGSSGRSAGSAVIGKTSQFQVSLWLATQLPFSGFDQLIARIG